MDSKDLLNWGDLIMKQLKLRNGETLIIRRAIRGDAPNLIDYMGKIGGESDFLTFGEGELDITVKKEEAIIESFIGVDNKLFIVAEMDNKIVGNLTYVGGHRSRTKHTGEFGVSLLKDYWGLGIGKELMEYMIDWAIKGKVVKKINLRVREDNERAIRLYTKLGFKKEGVISKEFYVNGKYYSSIFMGLEIE